MCEHIDLTRDDLKNKLSEICSKAHYIFALMAGLPKKTFCIIRYYDHIKNEDGEENLAANSFSLQQFLTRCDSMHPDDSFGLFFSTHRYKIDTKFIDNYSPSFELDEPSDLTLQQIKSSVDEFLECYCERCLRDNKPFYLTPETIERFGFTDEDVKALRPRLDRINKKAKKLILAEYRSLAELTCVQESLKTAE